MGIGSLVAYKNANDIRRLDVVNAGSLRKYRTSRAKLDSGTSEIYNVCCVGDSITEGIGSAELYPDYIANGYVGRLRTKLAAAYEDVGTGMIPVYYAEKWTLGGTWGDFTLIGIAGNSKYTAEENATATIAFTGTGLVLITMTGTATFRGDISTAVDGGAPTTVSLVETGASIKAVTVASGLASGAHTAVITNTQGAGKEFLVIGAYELKGTKGMRVNMCGKSGVSSVQLTTNANIMASEIDVYQPVLTIIATITNDIGGLVNVGTYRTNIQTLITRAKQYGDVLLLANNGREDRTDAEQSPYVNALVDLALANNCSLVNVYRRWGLRGTPLGMMDDILHPSPAGHQDIANALWEVLR